VGRVFERPAKENQNQIKIKMLTLKKVTGGGRDCQHVNSVSGAFGSTGKSVTFAIFFTEVHGTKSNFLKCS
jgi:hypothetical protein